MPLSRLTLAQPTWIPPDPIPEDIDLLALHPHRLIASLLWRRGIHTPEEAAVFMDARDPEALDPGHLPNMADAVQRVAAALHASEHIGIFGDYDADGVTSAALLYRALASVVGEDHVTRFVPDRGDGYGVSERGIRILAARGATLMIAADTGTNDHEAVALARSLGMDVVILDHHQVKNDPPPGAITVNPQLHPDLLYGELTGVGVSYLLIRALAAQGFRVARLDGDDERQMLDLVALGTVTDVGVLHGANRILVRAGLDVLRHSRRPGIRAMIRHGEFNPARLNADRISYGLGPRLNAAGRVASPAIALELLLTEDESVANDLALQLEKFNHARRLRSDQMLHQATELIAAMPDWETRPIIVIHHPEWESGLVGPIASKVVERMGRPALVMREEDGILQGSGRSVPGVDLVALLTEAAPLMTRFGGHAGAAGVTLPLENLDQFNAVLAGAVAQRGIELPQPPQIRLDAWLPEIAQRLDVARALDALEPFGQGNAVPLFGINDARLLEYSAMGREKQHLKLKIGTGQREMEAILWSGAARSAELVGSRRVDLAGRLSINEYRGVERLQLTLEDFRRAD